MQNKGAEVSIAIPKAKKPVKYERVSPGVYRGSDGELKRSASNPSAALAKRMPGAGDAGLRAAIGQGQGRENFMPGKGSVKDVFDRMNKNPSQPAPADADELIRRLSDMMNGSNNPLLQNPSPVPVPKMPIAPTSGYLAFPEGMQPALSDLLKGVNGPQIPRANSISDMLRRR